MENEKKNTCPSREMKPGFRTICVNLIKSENEIDERM